MHIKKLLYVLFFSLFGLATLPIHAHFGSLTNAHSPELIDKYKVPSFGQIISENTYCSHSYLTQQAPLSSFSEPFNPTSPAEPLSFGERVFIMTEPFYDSHGTLILKKPFVIIARKVSQAFKYIGSYFEPKAKNFENDPLEHAKVISFEKPLTEQIYKNELQTYLTTLDKNAYKKIYQRTLDRMDSLNHYEKTNTSLQFRYRVDNDVSSFMQKHDIDPESYQDCKGTVIQQRLHREILEILTINSDIEKIFEAHNATPLFTDLIVEGIELAHQCNEANEVHKGFLIADYCGWLTEAEYPYLASIVKHTAGVVVGAAEGVANIFVHAYDTIRHPIDSGKEIGSCLFYAGRFLTRATGEIAPFALHCMLRKTYEGHHLQPEFQKTINELQALYERTIKHLESLPHEERARELMRYFTEFFVSGKVMANVGSKAAHSLQAAQAGAISLADALELYKHKALTQTYQRANSIIINGKRHIQSRAEEFLNKLTKKEYALIGTDCERIIIDAEWAAAEMTPSDGQSLVSFNDSAKSARPLRSPKLVNPASLKPSNLSPINKVIEPTKNAATYIPQTANVLRETNYVTFKQELPALRARFDQSHKGWGPMADRYLKIDYEHILDADSGNTERLKGLHHDYLGHYEEHGILVIDNRIENSNGIYKGRAQWNNIGGSDKTFFPKHWTHKEVISNILEAYDNFIKDGAKASLEKNGKYKIKSFTNKGIEIEMFIDQKCNLITAYPKI